MTSDKNCFNFQLDTGCGSTVDVSLMSRSVFRSRDLKIMEPAITLKYLTLDLK